MNWLEHRIPPPIIGVLVAAAMWWVARLAAPPLLTPGVRIGLAALLVVIGLVFLAPATAAFRRARTTVNPLKPEQASSLVVAGVYRYTRNPMYVGFALLLLAWAAWLAVPVVLVGPLVFAAYLTRFQILPEERALEAAFGESFRAYRQRVRRWP
jgi:protein-S-isoprenylcysteine O-methyltransferase Ste14